MLRKFAQNVHKALFFLSFLASFCDGERMVKNLTERDVSVDAQKICREPPCILGAQIVTATEF